jgi:hypothetical protein
MLPLRIYLHHSYLLHGLNFEARNCFRLVVKDEIRIQVNTNVKY